MRGRCEVRWGGRDGTYSEWWSQVFWTWPFTTLSPTYLPSRSAPLYPSLCPLAFKRTESQEIFNGGGDLPTKMIRKVMVENIPEIQPLLEWLGSAFENICRSKDALKLRYAEQITTSGVLLPYPCKTIGKDVHKCYCFLLHYERKCKSWNLFGVHWSSKPWQFVHSDKPVS